MIKERPEGRIASFFTLLKICKGSKVPLLTQRHIAQKENHPGLLRFGLRQLCGTNDQARGTIPRTKREGI